MTAGRFSKQRVRLGLEMRIDSARSEYEEHARKPIDPRTGWFQAKDAPPRAQFAFGRWSALRDLLRDLDEGCL